MILCPRFLLLFASLALLGIGARGEEGSEAETTPSESRNIRQQTTEQLEEVLTDADSIVPLEVYDELALRYRNRMTAEDNQRLLDLMTRLEKEYPGDFKARSIATNAFILIGAWDRLEPYRESLQLVSVDPEGDLREGLRAARDGRLWRALVLMESASRGDPDKPEVLLNLGSMLCRFYNCEEGIVYFRRLTEVAPEDPYSFLALAKGAKTLRLRDEGLEAVNRALELIRENPVYEPQISAELEGLIVYFTSLDSTVEEPSSSEVP
jgi:tetratricopeptide (TPR) repeat protein